jgi:hypothetical protein
VVLIAQLVWLLAAVGLVAVIGVVAKWAGLAYLFFWILSAAPGIPIGLRLFRPHALGWIAGLAIGYTTSCIVAWAAIAIGLTSSAAFAGLWILECIALWIAARYWPWQPATTAAWTARDTIALSAVLLLTPLLMGAPYRNLGAADASGTRYYRAYFTADFVWHVALTAELGRFEMPPRNPYMATEPLHYYWTYFLVPAAVVARGPAEVRNVEAALEVNAICTAAILLASIFFLARSAGAGSIAGAVAVGLVVIAASAEGVIAMWHLTSRGMPLSELRDLNIDAITAWKYHGLRIDGVHRTMLYTPQHGLSCALALLALVPVASLGVALPVGVIVTTGLLLGLSTAINPFLGAAFSLIYGLFVLFDAVRTRSAITRLFLHAWAAIPPVLAIAWGTLNSMGAGAGGALTFGLAGFARNAPFVTLLMSLGPALVPALAVFIAQAKAWAYDKASGDNDVADDVPGRRLPVRPLMLAACGLIVGLGLLYFVMLSERSWVGFRAGQILLVMLTIPLAQLFGRLVASRHHVAACALGGAILALGAPTILVDLRNASDIANRSMGPGFPWTLTVTAPQQEALAWVRTNTPPAAIVQMDPMVRGRGHWSFIPTFAGRRMAAGLPISLLPVPAYRVRSRQVRDIFRAPEAGRAHDIARRLGIDYLWIDANERRAYQRGVAMIDAASGYFKPVYRNSEVAIYQVRH